MAGSVLVAVEAAAHILVATSLSGREALCSPPVGQAYPSGTHPGGNKAAHRSGYPTGRLVVQQPASSKLLTDWLCGMSTDRALLELFDSVRSSFLFWLDIMVAVDVGPPRNSYY